MNIRNASPEDAERIAEIYSYYVLNTAISFEIVPPDTDEIRRRMLLFRPNPYLVAEDNGRIAGYAYAHPLSDRPAYGRSVEVTIYLDKDEIGKGIGRALYDELETRLKMLDIHNLYAIVMHPGYGSVEFHERKGYRIVGKLTDCGEKFSKLWSVVYMEKNI